MNEEDEHFLSASHQKCILLSGTECHIINYLLTELARAVPGNIGPRSFLYGTRCNRSVLSQPRANIPQYGPHARLVRLVFELQIAMKVGEVSNFSAMFDQSRCQARIIHLLIYPQFKYCT